MNYLLNTLPYQININASENVEREELPCLAIIHFTSTFFRKLITTTEQKIFGQVYNASFRLPFDGH